MQTYGEEVKVYSLDKESGLIGSARFKGEAIQETPGGLWSWQGILTDPSFEPNDVWDVHDIRLEFFDGASGRAFCTKRSGLCGGASGLTIKIPHIL